jgi:hypothetical protein
MIADSPFVYTAIAEFVVPKSIPNTLLILNPLLIIIFLVFFRRGEKSPLPYENLFTG